MNTKSELLRKTVLSVLIPLLSGFSAYAEEPGPRLVADYDRDGRIDPVDRERARAGEAFTIWINDDDDADGDGDTNNDLHDVPCGKNGEGNPLNKDCEDDQVNGRCDLLDFFPVLVNVREVTDWECLTWKLCSDNVNVVFTGLKADNAGSFHTQEVRALDGNTPLYRATVENLTEDGVALPDELFLNGTQGEGVFLVEGRAPGSRCLTLRGYAGEALAAEVTLNLGVVNVEEMYGWVNLREKGSGIRDQGSGESRPTPVREGADGTVRDNRHFVLVHGYNTNHEEARGNAAEFYKKLYQSGSDAMFTAVEWKGDQSWVEFFGQKVTPNYHVNVENAFAAAKPFADACAKLPGEKILVGHSLGNVLISSAIKDYGLDYTKYVMLNAAVPREAYDAGAYDEDMVPVDWKDEVEKVGGGGDGGGEVLTNHLDRASRWYRNFADKKYDPYEYRRKLAWRGRFANLPRTVNYYSQSDNILVNPAPNEPDPDKVFDPDDPEPIRKVQDLLSQKLVNGKSIGRGGSKKTGFGFWAFSEKMKGTWLLDVVNDVLTNMLEVAQADAYKCEGGWGENDDYEEMDKFDPANTRFTPFLDERLKEWGMLDILPAETERVRAQHLADAIPAESFAAGANPVATIENVDEESFIGVNPDWPLYEGEGVRTNLWNHSAFREVAFYHTSKFYASLAAIGKPRVIIDTDLGSSMDDLWTIDFAARMHKAGKLDLMAVMMDRPDNSDEEGRGEFLKFADRYLATLGLGDLPLGKSSNLVEDRLPQHVFNPYWTLIYSNDVSGVSALMPTNRTDDQLAALTNAVVLYRRLLNDAPDKSVVICSTGFLNNLKALMESGIDHEGDGIDSTGIELIAAKVKELRIMGGCFDPAVAPEETGGAEYNVVGDPVAAKKVFEQWPSPVVISPWEVGLKLYYKSDDVLADFPAGTFDPVIRAAYTYWPDPGPDAMNRLWDPMTVLPLAEGETLAPLSEMGGISVDEKGVTTFTPDASSNRCYQVASNMNATAVMNRLREIYRAGNPSVALLVSGRPEPGVDYNGSELVFKFENLQLGSFAEEDLKFGFIIDGAEYAPESTEWDETLGVLSVRFVIPPDAVTAGNEYDGTLTVSLENDELGENIMYTGMCTLVQGRVAREEDPTDWFYEMELATPTNYVPATAMPERCLATVEATVAFTGQTFAVEYLSPTGAVQGAVRIVADGADGYKFQYYACVGKTNEDFFVRGWWDFNIGGEDAGEIRPVPDKEYVVRADAYYFEDARGEENTLVVSVEEVGSNRGMVKQFVGNLVNAEGGQGGSTRLHAVGFLGDGEIDALFGNYYANTVNANLARVDGDDGDVGEYATVAEAVAEADGNPIRLLHAASWSPSMSDIGKSVRFLNKSLLVMDDSELPFGMRPVWSNVDGNDGTLMLMQVYRDLTQLSPYLHEIWYEDYEDCSLTGEDAPFGELQLQGMGGCSSVRVGNFHGRNLDIAVSDLASIIVHMAASDDRFASVGTTQWGDVSETALTNGTVSARRFDVLPSWMLDGINENGVAINVNIIPMDVPQDGEDPESDERPAMHARKVVRYVLDHAESAEGVIEQLKGFRIFGNIGAIENNIHWMISDAEKTFVVEIIKGEVVAREHPIMTNFNINWDNGSQSKITNPEEWGPEKYFWAAAYSNDTDKIFETYSLHAEGIERYIRLRDNGAGYLERGKTLEGMFDLMRETQYSKIAYLPLSETYLSDLLDMQEVKDAGFGSLADIYAASNAVKLAEMWETLRPKMTNVYENLAKYRDPDGMVPYSITTHNVTFDLARKMFRIAVQEDYAHTFDIWLVPQSIVPVTPGVPVVFDTDEEATNAMANAVVTPSEEVAAALGSDAACGTYRNMFFLDIVPTSDDKWAVAALLKPEGWTNVVLSAAAATRQIPVAGIAALADDATTNVTVTGCEPGFYYTLHDGAVLTGIVPDTDAANRDVLCGADGKVVFPAVGKPSDAMGFFRVGVDATK